MSVTVIVAKAGIYLDAEWKAQPEAAEGATITVAGGAYVDSLLKDGYVALPGTEPAAPVVVETEPKQPINPVDPVVEVEPPSMPVELEPTKKKGK